MQCSIGVIGWCASPKKFSSDCMWSNIKIFLTTNSFIILKVYPGWQVSPIRGIPFRYEIARCESHCCLQFPKGTARQVDVGDRVDNGV